MKIYMDVCCYNRPMDDQTQERVRIETEAIFYIFNNLEALGLELIGSSVIDYELNGHSNIIKRRSAYGFYGYAKKIYNIFNYPNAGERVSAFETLGVGSIDSWHLAAAEIAGVQVLLTTDDKFIKAAARTDSPVRVVNPLLWLMEAFFYE